MTLRRAVLAELSISNSVDVIRVSVLTIFRGQRIILIGLGDLAIVWDRIPINTFCVSRVSVVALLIRR